MKNKLKTDFIPKWKRRRAEYERGQRRGNKDWEPTEHRPRRQANMTSHDQITLTEAQRRLGGSEVDKVRGGATKSRHARRMRRGHALKQYEWSQQ